MHGRLTRKTRITAILACAGLIAVVLLAGSCSTTNRTVVVPLKIEGATFVGDKACADCHENITRIFPASAHSRLRLENSGLKGANGCEGCHGPGSKHIAMGGRGGIEKFIINPRKDPAACMECHSEVRAEFHYPQHHPVLEGKMNCVQCHDPHGMDIKKPAGGLAMTRNNDTCAQCHREQTKPVMFEHPALREGCTACHTPHGSVNAKMLTIPDSNLCLRCHAQNQGPIVAPGSIFIGGRDHTTSVTLGTCWTAGCHTAVHGSNVHISLLY